MESVGSVLFVFSAVLLWLLVLVQVDAQSRVEEVQVLTNFRKEMEAVNGGVSASIFGYWFSWNENDENACPWVGVTCSTNYTVAGLDLSGWDLVSLASLAALSKLPDLRELDMSSTILVGTWTSTGSRTASITLSIPDDIGTFTQLTRLDFSGNQYEGTLPPNISNCRSLQYLSLEKNQFTGATPDLSEMVHSQQYLHLADNQLYGPFPRELGELSSLLIILMWTFEFHGGFRTCLKSWKNDL